MALTLTLSNITISRRSSDGSVNLTQLCQAGGKYIANWAGLAKSQAFLRVLSESIGMSIDNLISYEIAGKTERATWGHPQVAINIAQWISPEFDVKVSKWIYELAATGQVELGQEKSPAAIDEAWKNRITELEVQLKDRDEKVHELHSELKAERVELERVAKNHQSMMLRRRRHQYSKGPAFYIMSLQAYPDHIKPGFAENFSDRGSSYNTHVPEDAKLEFLLYSPKAALIEDLIKIKYQGDRSRANREWIQGVSTLEMIRVVRSLVIEYLIPYHEQNLAPAARVVFTDPEEDKKEEVDELVSLRERIIEALNAHATQTGERPKAQTWKAERGLGIASVIKAFGTWNDALAAAGLETIHKRDVGRQEMIEALQNRARELGSRPFRAQDWVGPPGMGLSKIIKTFGSWNCAMAEAGQA